MLLSFVKFEPTESNETTIIRARTFDGKPVQMETPHPYERCQKALWDYNQGAKVQDAFPFLTVDERNFMQCGMTPEEFDAACPDE